MGSVFNFFLGFLYKFKRLFLSFSFFFILLIIKCFFGLFVRTLVFLKYFSVFLGVNICLGCIFLGVDFVGSIGINKLALLLLDSLFEKKEKIKINEDK